VDGSYYKVNVKKLLLCSTATLKKTGFQTYFNHISLGCRHPRLRAEEEKKKKRVRATTCNRNLKIWVVKNDLSLFHSVINKIWNLILSYNTWVY
jgi:hypothetical protein